jgi:SAM-dependent methyltransferase
MSKRQDRERKKREEAAAHTKRQARKAKEELQAGTEKVKATVAKARSDYADEWAPNSQMHHDKGHYQWMVSQLEGHPRVLEIGVGGGHSTLALAKAGHTVVSVDENTECLQRTKSLLQSEGLDPVLLLRGEVALAEGGMKYSISYAPPNIAVPDGGVVLIEGDAIRDPSLREWLGKLAPFDAVACWLMGTHGARRVGLDAVVHPDAINQPGMYRLQVQNETYKLAAEVLRAGGILQVVDRGQTPTEDYLRDDIIQAHKAQAAPTQLSVEGVTHIEIESASTQAGIEIQYTPGTSGRVPDKLVQALVSVISRKQ